MTDHDKYLSSEDAKDFYQTFLNLKTEEECRDFLRDLLTEKEIKEFINRWKVVRLLDDKMPYEEITESTGMSSTTIARISKWLHDGMGGYHLMLKRLKRKQS